MLTTSRAALVRSSFLALEKSRSRICSSVSSHDIGVLPGSLVNAARRSLVPRRAKSQSRKLFPDVHFAAAVLVLAQHQLLFFVRARGVRADQVALGVALA